MKSRRRIFRRKRASSMWLLGVLTLAFAGSFAAALVTSDWEDHPQMETARGVAGTALSGADGLMARIPALRLAASSASVALPDRR
jgi:hypothetical protein